MKWYEDDVRMLPYRFTAAMVVLTGILVTVVYNVT